MEEPRAQGSGPFDVVTTSSTTSHHLGLDQEVNHLRPCTHYYVVCSSFAATRAVFAQKAIALGRLSKRTTLVVRVYVVRFSFTILCPSVCQIICVGSNNGTIHNPPLVFQIEKDPG